MAADGVPSDSVRYACYNPGLYQVPNGDLYYFKTGPNVAGWTQDGLNARRITMAIHGVSERYCLKTIWGPIKNKTRTH